MALNAMFSAIMGLCDVQALKLKYFVRTIPLCSPKLARFRPSFRTAANLFAEQTISSPYNVGAWRFQPLGCTPFG